MQDCFKQKWFSDMESNSVLNNLYINIKPTFGIASYLDKVISSSSRRGLTRLRISAHSLRIESGRYGRDRLERHQRLCQFCDSQEIEDEYHFIIKCKLYKNIRSDCIKRYFYSRPSMFKFLELLMSENKRIIINLCKYIHRANTKRNELLIGM